jgi:outer membrane protein assembly factor BamB
VAGGRVLVSGRHLLAALDPETGATLWSLDPSPAATGTATFASVAVSADGTRAVGLFGRGEDGYLVFDPASGAELYRVAPPISIGTSASPIIDGETLFLGGTATGLAGAFDLATGVCAWQRTIYGIDTWWGAETESTPAVAGGLFLMPTARDLLWVEDAATGVERWVAWSGPSAIRASGDAANHYAFMGSPAVTGDVVWIGGADGVLRALDLDGGDLLGSLDLGAPILAAPTPAGDALVVATYDGVVRALVASPEATAPPGGGCRVGGGGGGLSSVLVLVLVLVLGRFRIRC